MRPDDAVRDHAFQSQPHLDAATMVLGHQQQQDAAVRRLIADAPFLKERVGKIFNRLVFQRLDRHHEELRMRLLLSCRHNALV